MKNLILPILLFSSFNSYAREAYLSQLKAAEFSRMNGTKLKFEEVEIFACSNIPNNRFLFNKSYSDHCWIKNPNDAKYISGKLGGNYWGPNTVFFQKCPQEMANDVYCDPKKLRDF
jgi:hypothetical protein